MARGRWVDSAPSWLIGKYYLDLIDVSRHEEGYQTLLATILGKLPQAPPLGSLSDAERLAATIVRFIRSETANGINPARLRLSSLQKPRERAGRRREGFIRARARRLSQVEEALTVARIFPFRAARRLETGEPFGISDRPLWSNSSKTRLAAPRAHTSSPQ